MVVVLYFRQMHAFLPSPHSRGHACMSQPRLVFYLSLRTTSLVPSSSCPCPVASLPRRSSPTTSHAHHHGGCSGGGGFVRCGGCGGSKSGVRDTLHLVVMEPLRKRNSSGVLVKEEIELEDGNDLLVERRRTDVSGSIVQLQQQTEVSDMENKASDSLPLEDSSGKDPMNLLTSCAVQNCGQVNGRRNESAISKLVQIWKAEPSYDFEEEGPPHMKLFKCKVTIHLDGPVNTIVECFSDPKPRKKAAKEHAAQGALWYLKASGYVKGSPDVS